MSPYGFRCDLLEDCAGTEHLTVCILAMVIQARAKKARMVFDGCPRSAVYVHHIVTHLAE
jgi:hypothetical protein